MIKKFNLRGRIICALRRIWLYSPLRREAKARAKAKKLYKCAGCKKHFAKVHVDHIKPVVDIDGFPLVTVYDDDVIPDDVEVDHWSIYINRLFCTIDNLQCLCDECHKRKTDNERKSRRAKKTT